MSPKKIKRPQAAQQLIEDLLDESVSSQGPSSGDAANEVQMDGSVSFGTGLQEESKGMLVLEGFDGESAKFKLEHSQKIVLDPVGLAHKTAMTEQISRLAEARPPTPPPFESTKSKNTPLPIEDINFGDVSSDEHRDEVEEEERTVRVPFPVVSSAPPVPNVEPQSLVIPITRKIDRGGATEIRSGVKVPPAPRDLGSGLPSSAFTSSEAALKQSESLRIAQSRISELERELERVRRDNEALSTAGDTFRRRTDELTSKAESFEAQAREATRMLDEEKKVMRGQLQSKDRENAEMRVRVEEIETRLESNFKKIRVRERELEHRLEIVKMESATLISTKDKMILDLKRQIDQLHHEGDSAKSKTQELFGQYKEKQDTIRRVVRALRIALTILEGDDEAVAQTKKAE